MREQEYTLEVYKADKRKKEGRRLIEVMDVIAKSVDDAEDIAVLKYGADDKLIVEVHKTYREVRNAMNGEIVEERYDTPYSCSVASESYWCS